MAVKDVFGRSLLPAGLIGDKAEVDAWHVLFYAVGEIFFSSGFVPALSPDWVIVRDTMVQGFCVPKVR